MFIMNWYQTTPPTQYHNDNMENKVVTSITMYDDDNHNDDDDDDKSTCNLIALMKHLESDRGDCFHCLCMDLHNPGNNIFLMFVVVVF